MEPDENGLTFENSAPCPKCYGRIQTPENVAEIVEGEYTDCPWCGAYLWWDYELEENGDILWWCLHFDQGRDGDNIDRGIKPGGW